MGVCAHHTNTNSQKHTMDHVNKLQDCRAELDDSVEIRMLFGSLCYRRVKQSVFTNTVLLFFGHVYVLGLTHASYCLSWYLES